MPILAAAPVGPKTRPRDSISQIVDREILGVAKNNRALDYVAQFADVTGPGIRLKQVQRFSAYTPNVFSGFPGVAIDKVLHQHRNVFSSLPQRRNLKRKYIQAVEKILAERAGSYASLQVTVSRNYH